MPTKLYGTGDNYDLETSRVIPALIRKMHLGKCLERGDWIKILADLNSQPIIGVDGAASKQLIIDTLSTHGIGLKCNELQGKNGETKFALPTTHSTPLNTEHLSPVTVKIWGTGAPRRELLHVDDMAAACVHVMSLDKATYIEHTQPMLSHINIGTGKDCTIKELAQTIAYVVGFEGQLHFDVAKPDGTSRKLLDVSRLKKMGWQAGIELEDGLKNAYEVYSKGGR
jgi:GDP-L-fucose synthase